MAEWLTRITARTQKYSHSAAPARAGSSSNVHGLITGLVMFTQDILQIKKIEYEYLSHGLLDLSQLTDEEVSKT